MCEMLPVDETNFKESVLHSNLPVLVEFGAEWCQPCRQVEKIFEQMLSDEWKNKVSVYHVDVDRNVNLAMDYQIMSVPTVILFVQGEVKERLTGAQSRQRYREKVTVYL